MKRNPYAEALGQRDPTEVLAVTPQKLEAAFERLTADEIERHPAPGKWNLREVAAHLADCELAFGFRLRQGAAGVDIQPFDQDDWARHYDAYSFAAARTTYRALRAWNLAFISALTEQQKAQPVTHPERGAMTVWTIVETMAGHDLHHLAALDRTLAR